MEADTPRRGQRLVPTLAVAAVAASALLAAVMARHADPEPQQVAAVRDTGRAAPAEVVKAPPLAPDTKAMGGAPACDSCGVVQTVVAVREAGKTEPRGYQMHIRMDDGSTRTVEHRGALPAGSRVVVEGADVRPLS